MTLIKLCTTSIVTLSDPLLKHSLVKFPTLNTIMRVRLEVWCGEEYHCSALDGHGYCLLSCCVAEQLL